MIFKRNKNKSKKVYDFKYKIYWRDESISEGNITNSTSSPEVIFLKNRFVCFSGGKCAYFNSDDIKQIEIFDLVEKEKN